MGRSQKEQVTGRKLTSARRWYTRLKAQARDLPQVSVALRDPEIRCGILSFPFPCHNTLMISSNPPTDGHGHTSPVSVIPQVLSTKVHSHQSNVNRKPQSGVRKQEKLYSEEQLANQGNTVSGRNSGDKGEATFYKESPRPSSQLVHFYANQKSKSAV